MTTAQALGNIGLDHAASEGATTTITLTTADAVAVGETLRALSRTAPMGARESMARVGGQLASAGYLAMKAGGK